LSRVIGLDFGSKTVGVAVSDPLGLTAQGVEIIRRDRENKIRKTLARIEELCAQYEAECIVLGLPRNMNYSAGARVLATLDFRDQLLRRTGLPVLLWDERLTTVAAQDAMHETGLDERRQKEFIDEVAAMLILQGYLDCVSAGAPVRQPDIEALRREAEARCGE